MYHAQAESNCIRSRKYGLGVTDLDEIDKEIKIYGIFYLLLLENRLRESLNCLTIYNKTSHQRLLTGVLGLRLHDVINI